MRKLSVKNKKGVQMEPEWLVDLLAFVIVALILLGFGLVGYRLYKAAAMQEEENAKNTINVIESALERVDVGVSGKLTVQGFKGVENWLITGWSITDPNRPEKCSLKSCICICSSEASSGVEGHPGIADTNFHECRLSDNGYAREDISEYMGNICQKKGFCRFVPEKEVLFEGENNCLTVFVPGLKNLESNLEEDSHKENYFLFEYIRGYGVSKNVVSSLRELSITRGKDSLNFSFS